MFLTPVFKCIMNWMQLAISSQTTGCTQICIATESEKVDSHRIKNSN
jgi:hypothetical protein